MRTGIDARARRWKLAAAALLALGVAATSGAAELDGARTGWQLGGSVGFRDSAVEFTEDDVTRRDERGGRGPAVNLHVGYGFSERFALHLASHSGSHARGGAPDYGFTVLGPGASWWLHADGRGSPYLSTTFGTALVATDDELPGVAAGENGDASGAALRLVVGYEFVNRLRVEGAILGLGARGGFVPDDETFSVGSSSLSIGYAWY